MRKLITCLLLIMLGTVACKKDKSLTTKYITLSYKQTYCADPWAIGSNDDQTLENVADYLEARGLHFASLQIKQVTPAELCLACQCKTGKTIYVSVPNSDNVKAQYQEIGFQP